MAYELKMPKLGESVTEGTIGKWLKQPGEKVNKYDLLVEVQTDKVNTEIPSPVAGTLKEVKVQEGQTVPIGTLLAIFDTADGEAAQPSAAEPQAASQSSAATQPAAAAPRASTPQSNAPSGPSANQPSQRSSAPTPEAPPPSRAAPEQRAAPPPPQGSSPRPASAATATEERPDLSDVRATPAVRKLAGEHGIDISQIEGTGLGGRVSRKDVEDFIAQQESRQQAAARVVPAPPQA